MIGLARWAGKSRFNYYAAMLLIFAVFAAACGFMALGAWQLLAPDAWRL